ncbi:MAG: ATP-grasp domain-containing protein, partial [Campylobacterota bacterium]
VFCEPIGHKQQDGDYILSWQPMPMSELALKRSRQMAQKVTDGLGGRGIYGVELFIKGDDVYFSEVSPRPHDTGMVTLITQSQSEFALHLRAVLGLPLDFIFHGSGASGAYKAKNQSNNPLLEVPSAAFSQNSYVRIFGKPHSHEGRRMAVSLVLDEVTKAKAKALQIISQMDDR